MARRKGSDSQGRQFQAETIDRVWERAERVPGKDSNLYRQDAAGNTLFRRSYGKDSEMGWEIDHKNPVSEGGSDNLRNLQPLQTDENRQKGGQYPWKPKK